jgi:hypothetical protein
LKMVNIAIVIVYSGYMSFMSLLTDENYILKFSPPHIGYSDRW